MKKYKTEIKISTFLVGIPFVFIIAMGIFFLGQHFQTSKKTYFIFENGNVWSFQGDKVEDLTDSKQKNEILKNIEFSVYVNNNYQRTSYVQEKNSDWYYQDNLDKRIPSSMFAYSGEENLEVIQFDIEKLTQEDLDILNKYTVQKDYTITNIDELTYNEKVSLDFDQDGLEETLYVASNLYDHFENPESGEKTFLIILYYDGYDSKVLRNSYINKEDEFEGDMTTFEIDSIIKLPNQEKYSIIFNRYKTMGGLPICPTLFEYRNNTFEMVKTCKEMES